MLKTVPSSGAKNSCRCDHTDTKAIERIRHGPRGRRVTLLSSREKWERNEGRTPNDAEREVLLQPIISVSNLSKTYASGLQALKNINLDIRRGEIFALRSEEHTSE